MITTMLTRLLAHPAEGLPPEHTSFLLHIFESYRNMQRDLENMKQKARHRDSRLSSIGGKTRKW